MDTQSHWERVYSSKAPTEVSWFRPHLETSLALIERVAGDRSASIIDVGGGESTLVDDLIDKGYLNVTVLDISRTAIEHSKKRMSSVSSKAVWLVADVTRCSVRREILTVKCYRRAFGDAGLPDIEIAGTPFHTAKEAAKNILLNYFNDCSISADRKPEGASLVGEDGRIVIEFTMRYSSSGVDAVDEVGAQQLA